MRIVLILEERLRIERTARGRAIQACLELGAMFVIPPCGTKCGHVLSRLTRFIHYDNISGVGKPCTLKAATWSFFWFRPLGRLGKSVVPSPHDIEMAFKLIVVNVRI